MTLIAFIRHGLTEWNEAERIQGHTDIPLSAKGQADFEILRVPEGFEEARWCVSPLTRARQTADLLGVQRPEFEPRLKERCWGDWEGKTRDELMTQYPQDWEERSARGRNFRPQGGETAAELQERVMTWVDEQAAKGGVAGAVCHRGVITAIMARALDWDFHGKPPVRMHWVAAHVFCAHGNGRVTIESLNQALPLKTL